MQQSEPDGETISIKSKAKKLLENALAPVADDLAHLHQHLLSYVPVSTKTSEEVVHHVLGTEGKLIRPALYFLCCRIFGYQGEQLYPMAAVSELVHTASLLHDDVVDSSTLRRNKPTAKSIWGDQASILVGDLIYARASEMMAATGKLAIVQTFAEAIRKMSEGELLQLETAFDSKMPLETYLRIIDHKTSTLIAASCRTAGILAETDKETQNRLAEIGFTIGMAFQLIDDALDYLVSEDQFGKPTLSDLREGKVTYPIITLLKEIPPAKAEILHQKIQSGQFTDEDLKEINGLVEEYQTAEKALSLAEQQTDLALDQIFRLPSCQAREDLERLARHLLMRDT